MPTVAKKQLTVDLKLSEVKSNATELEVNCDGGFDFATSVLNFRIHMVRFTDHETVCVYNNGTND